MYIFDSVAGLVTLQNLQNLASMQGLPQVASLAAGLSNMTQNITNIAANPPPSVNTPLNLSVSASGKDLSNDISSYY